MGAKIKTGRKQQIYQTKRQFKGRDDKNVLVVVRLRSLQLVMLLIVCSGLQNWSVSHFIQTNLSMSHFGIF